MALSCQQNCQQNQPVSPVLDVCSSCLIPQVCAFCSQLFHDPLGYRPTWDMEVLRCKGWGTACPSEILTYASSPLPIFCVIGRVVLLVGSCCTEPVDPCKKHTQHLVATLRSTTSTIDSQSTINLTLSDFCIIFPQNKNNSDSCLIIYQMQFVVVLSTK